MAFIKLKTIHESLQGEDFIPGKNCYSSFSNYHETFSDSHSHRLASKLVNALMLTHLIARLIIVLLIGIILSVTILTDYPIFADAIQAKNLPKAMKKELVEKS